MISFEQFKQLDIRVAEILSVEDHPNADKLYVLRISIGEEERKIVAGIKVSYEPKDLLGKKIIVLVNLEPADIRGERSQGMLLAADSDGKPVILEPDSDIPAGSLVR